MNSENEKYKSILLCKSKERAEEIIRPIVDDMISWTCWCVTPSRPEVENIVRKNCIAYASQKTSIKQTKKIAALFGFSDISFLPEKK